MSKNIFRIISLAIVLIVVIMAPFCIGSTPFDINFSKVENSQVLLVWHIETFEGGSVSRERYLEKQSIAFEKLYPGKLLLIQTLTYDEAAAKIESGEVADIISFGVGAGDLFIDYVKEISIKPNFRNDLLDYCNINNKLCAVPYMLGGYCKIAKDTTDTIYACIDNQNIIKDETNIEYVDFSHYQLYQNFIAGKYDGILGTQRDVYRINNRINLGKLDNCNFEYIGGFSDLVQYFAITTNVESEIKIAENFISYVLSDVAQAAIKDYGMFSVNRSIYSSGVYKDFEKVIEKKISSINAFTRR